ncbi:MAG: class I SAM-dependent methyltransferase [Fidelibacterota bacterium]
MDNKVKLDREKETLLVPLYGKALESRKKHPVLYDKKAMEIVNSIDYDFDSLKIPGKTNTLISLRAKLIDNFARDFVMANPDALVLHLGCGLDSRYDRLKCPAVEWYDLDYPEVIDIRRQFFPESEYYHLVASSVTEYGWIDAIPIGKPACLVIAEGLLMYLREADIQQLLKLLHQHVGHYTLIFDAFSKYTARRVRKHPSLKKTGAKTYWGIDDPREMSGWFPGIRFVREIYFTKNDELNNLGPATRLIYKLAHCFPVARNAQRIMVYEVD